MPIAFYRKYHFYAYSLPTFLATDITYIKYKYQLYIQTCSQCLLREISLHILTKFSSSLSETNLRRKPTHFRTFINVFRSPINRNITNLMASRIQYTVCIFPYIQPHTWTLQFHLLYSIYSCIYMQYIVGTSEVKQNANKIRVATHYQRVDELKNNNKTR